MTIVVDAPEMEQVKKQLHKLVNVVRITELDPAESLEREIMLIRVASSPGKRSEILEISTIFKATVIDVGPTSIAFTVSGEPRKINDFVDLVRPYGIVELVKSGRIAMARDLKSRKLKAIG